jgi:2-keto-myo-inositol isomerase
MRLCLNGATIMRSPLTADFEIAAECGFSALEIWAGKLEAHLEHHTLADVRAKARALGITPWCINSIEDITFRDADGRKDLLAEVERMAAAGRYMGAPSIVVVPGQQPGGLAFNRNESINDAVEALVAMSEAAAEVGLAFEFLGKPGCAVPRLDMAIEIIERTDRANVGMVIDTFHFYAGGSRLDDITRVPVDRLFVLHLNGCEDLPKSELTDAHRLYPGEGAIPLQEILSTLRARGFDGTASVEIFRPAYWEQDPRDVARTAFERAATELTRAGYAVT